jgi:hypothetical protein
MTFPAIRMAVWATFASGDSLPASSFLLAASAALRSSCSACRGGERNKPCAGYVRLLLATNECYTRTSGVMQVAKIKTDTWHRKKHR